MVITMNFDLTWGDTGMVNDADHRAVGLAVLDAVRDAANPWVFTDAGPAWGGTSEVYVAAEADPTHFVDVTATIGVGVDSLREHKAYLDGLGRDFDPDEFLRNVAGYPGMAAGVSTRWACAGTRPADRFRPRGRPVPGYGAPPPAPWRQHALRGTREALLDR